MMFLTDCLFRPTIYLTWLLRHRSLGHDLDHLESRDIIGHVNIVLAIICVVFCRWSLVNYKHTFILHSIKQKKKLGKFGLITLTFWGHMRSLVT